MTKKILSGTIQSKQQLTNSKEGGPRVRCIIRMSKDSHSFIPAVTAPNSSAGYCLTCSMEYLKDREMIFEYHETKTGTIIIDSIISGYYERG